MSKKIEVSILIVNYNAKKELFNCINSIYESKPTVSYEIIVIDNEETKSINKELLKKFPQVIYIENKTNNGWGGGINYGEQYATGKYLYLLNPDTIVINDAIDSIYKFSNNHSEYGIVSSLLLDKNKKIYPLQGTLNLNPFNSLVILSGINKKIPNNPISFKFWLKDWNKITIRDIPVVPLSAALVRKSVFIKAGKFDENLFLYYEEYDFGRRVRKLGYKTVIYPSSQIIHIWEASTKKRSDISQIIENSRNYYFKKYYGVLGETFVKVCLNLLKSPFKNNE